METDNLLSPPSCELAAAALEMGVADTSLFFCLTLDNPFQQTKWRDVPEVRLSGYAAEDDSPATLLKDGDFLLSEADSDAEVADEPPIPTKFQKVIELLLRLQARQVLVSPSRLLSRTTIPNPEFPGNFFHGWSLRREAALLSPDGDEMYLQLHFPRSVLLEFAHRQGLLMVTNPFSSGGGAGMTFSKEAEKSLAHSVDVYRMKNDVPDWAVLGKDASDHRDRGWGFCLDTPQKMRIASRLLREGWRFGGCGFQFNELRKKKILVRHFFPLHNSVAIEKFELTMWGSVLASVSLSPLKQNEDHLVKYFGEAIALYFVWLREYIVCLCWPAMAGLVCGALDASGKASTSVVNALFSIFLVVWAFGFCKVSQRRQAEFSSAHAQDVETKMELVRDEFEPSSEDVLEPKQLVEMDFSTPLTLQRKPNGMMVQLAYPGVKRLAWRYGFTYPCVILLTSLMLTALIWINVWRFRPETLARSWMGIVASVASVVVSLVFGKIFDVSIGWLNSLENNRTEAEEAEQFVLKGFLFYFFNSYFSLGIIMLWPSETTTNVDRLNQLYSQMGVIALVKPMIQNLQEMAVPWIMAELRRRGDLLGGQCRALCSLVRCRRRADIEKECNLNPKTRHLWKETQLEPYDGGLQDYLEMTLQFGYMSMFAATFVWSPLAALLYNVLELRLDAKRLLTLNQRPLHQTATSIGAWNSIFWGLAGLSVVTNSYIVFILSPLPEKLQFSSSETNRYKQFTILQYFFAVILVLVVSAVDPTPDSVVKRQVKQELLRDAAIRRSVFPRADRVRPRRPVGGPESEAATASE